MSRRPASTPSSASLRGVLSHHATNGTVLATHQTEDVAAVCDRVIVLDEGQVRFDGAVPELVGTADGQVWVGPVANDGALSSWRTGTGAIRSVGGTPSTYAVRAEPAVEDAYLLMRVHAQKPEPQRNSSFRSLCSSRR
jgi:ABC-2 type transport system ATP-binding protein